MMKIVQFNVIYVDSQKEIKKKKKVTDPRLIQQPSDGIFYLMSYNMIYCMMFIVILCMCN